LVAAAGAAAGSGAGTVCLSAFDTLTISDYTLIRPIFLSTLTHLYFIFDIPKPNWRFKKLILQNIISFWYKHYIKIKRLQNS